MNTFITKIPFVSHYFLNLLYCSSDSDKTPIVITKGVVHCYYY